MTLRDDLLEVLDEARAIADDLGMHQVLVTLRQRTWSSGKINTGVSTITDTVISPTPHVRGTSGDQEIDVGPITPAYAASLGFPSGGYTPAELNPSTVPGADPDYYFLITFNDGVVRKYVLQPRGVDTSRPMRIMLKLKTLDRKTPF